MDELIAAIIVSVVTAIIVGNIASERSYNLRHAELCPTILEQSLTAADSLAVFEKHEGCWEFSQKENNR